jgi:hypothetical protein
MRGSAPTPRRGALLAPELARQASASVKPYRIKACQFAEHTYRINRQRGHNQDRSIAERILVYLRRDT